MRSEFHLGRYWAVLSFSFACGAAFFLLAAALLVQAWQGHLHQPSDILRLAFAVMSLLLGFFCVTVGTLYHASFRESSNR